MQVSERLLQFIWQFQYFNTQELFTYDGEPLQIIHPGQNNSNQGPDFFDARIRIGGTVWAGTVELHIQSSVWDLHKHGNDANYANVILHVVWQVDVIPNRLPLLELKGRIPGLLLDRFVTLMQTPASIPCGSRIGETDAVVWAAWKERMVAERLMRKAKAIHLLLAQNNHHWDETCWWMLARNFGMKVNADAFELVARSIPFRVLQRCRMDLHQIEALLFGQSGLVHRKLREVYPRKLLESFTFLQHKYGLRSLQVPFHFLRMRPGNFPTIRLAQLAAVVHRQEHLFAMVRDAAGFREAKEMFTATASHFWNTHYRFGEKTEWMPKKTGDALVNSVMINLVVPLLFAYGEYYQVNRYKEKAVEWLLLLKAESNAVTELYKRLAVEIGHAYDSQALLELHGCYCSEKRCLDCGVGVQLLRNG